jgi:hypothetical protein
MAPASIIDGIEDGEASGPNQPLQQTAAVVLTCREFTVLSSVPAAELNL